VWAGTVDAGLFLVSDASTKRFTTADGLPSNDVRAIWASPGGDVWVGTGGAGVARMRNGRVDRFGVADGIGSGDVRELLRRTAMDDDTRGRRARRRRRLLDPS
jgi:ligand-binding sensor domain-containing protein